MVFLTNTAFFASIPSSQAGLSKFTTIDKFEGWIIERKIELPRNEPVCRASMPKYGSWFGARVRLGFQDDLVLPSYAMTKYELNAKLMEKLKLTDCKNE